MRVDRTAIFAALALAACSAGGDESDTQASAGAAAGGALPAAEADRAIEDYVSTAWRAMAEDGARYTTYLDPGGTYRDLRNGDPWQTGSWVHDAEGQGRICLTPEGENAVRECWMPGAMQGDILPLTNARGRRIELERVDYAAPPEEPAETGDA